MTEKLELEIASYMVERMCDVLNANDHIGHSAAFFPGKDKTLANSKAIFVIARSNSNLFRILREGLAKQLEGSEGNVLQNQEGEVQEFFKTDRRLVIPPQRER